MSDKKKGTNFLMQGTILAAAAMITKIVGLAYRIPLTNIMGGRGKRLLRRCLSGVQPCIDADILQPSHGCIQTCIGPCCVRAV